MSLVWGGPPNGKMLISNYGPKFSPLQWYICMFLVKPFAANLLVFDLIRLQMFRNAIFLCIEARSLGFVKVMGCAQFSPNVFNSRGQWRERSVFCLTRRNGKGSTTFYFPIKKKNHRTEKDWRNRGGIINPRMELSKLKYLIKILSIPWLSLSSQHCCMENAVKVMWQSQKLFSKDSVLF